MRCVTPYLKWEISSDGQYHCLEVMSSRFTHVRLPLLTCDPPLPSNLIYFTINCACTTAKLIDLGTCLEVLPTTTIQVDVSLRSLHRVPEVFTTCFTSFCIFYCASNIQCAHGQLPAPKQSKSLCYS